MLKIGYRIRLRSRKGPDREGVITAVTGSMLRVRWQTEDETTIVPAPGTLTVLAPPPPQKTAAEQEDGGEEDGGEIECGEEDGAQEDRGEEDGAQEGRAQEGRGEEDGQESRPMTGGSITTTR